MKRVICDLAITTLIFIVFVGALLLSNYLHYGQFLF